MSVQDVIVGWIELEAALPGYQQAEDYYDGDISEVFCFDNPVLADKMSSVSERYRFNLAKTPVDVLADRVQIRSVSTGQEGIDRRIQEIWDANDLDIYYPMLIKKSFIYGDAYMQNWPINPSDVEEGLIDDQLAVEGMEFSVHNPKHCRVVYDPENERRKLFAIKRWPYKTQGQETQWRVDIYYSDRVERYLSVLGQDQKEPVGWTQFTEDEEETEDWLIENPFGEIPFFHHRNDIPYGKPEHYDAYGPQDAITKLLVTHLATTDSQGAPGRYRLLSKDAELDTNQDTPDWDDDSNATTGKGPNNLAGVPSALRSGPGTMQDFTGTDSVGEWSAADPNVFIGPAPFYIRLMAQNTTTPLHYFDPSGDTPSGESLRVADAPLNKKAQTREQLLESAVSENWVCVLGYFGIKVTNVNVQWAPTEVATGMSDWQVIQAKQESGVPQDQTLVEAGYDAAQVETWLNNDKEAMDINRRVALLNSMGDAIQKLGTGVSLGMISQDEASAVVDQIMRATTPESDDGEDLQ